MTTEREGVLVGDGTGQVLPPLPDSCYPTGALAVDPVPKLTVWYGPMPESNGRTNWTAILHRGDMSEGHTIDRSQYPGRVRYAADRVRWLLGELEKKPFILDYNGDERTPCHLCGGSGQKDGKPCWGLNFEGTVHDAAPGAVGPDDAQRKLAQHFNESPNYSVEGALAAAGVEGPCIGAGGKSPGQMTEAEYDAARGVAPTDEAQRRDKIAAACGEVFGWKPDGVAPADPAHVWSLVFDYPGEATQAVGVADRADLIAKLREDVSDAGEPNMIEGIADQLLRDGVWHDEGGCIRLYAHGVDVPAAPLQGETLAPDVPFKATLIFDSETRVVEGVMPGVPVALGDKPADATPQEWAAAVRLTFATARSLSALQGIPSHWLEAMRDCALGVAGLEQPKQER